MLKKSVFVLTLAAVGLIVGTTVVSASTHYADLCMAAAAVGGSASSVGSGPLASTGSSINVGLWVLIGAVALAVGLALTLMGRSGRATNRVSS